ncbi:hypothetical protein Pla110_36520 [Polystyrenella longa]|uniref:Uncharacterized protein n=1 Tax=Polystyrenella longa TaxID=2528007 RepID=A0A518CRP9_9PLAN|nr:hypothetical protein [Polystyrenella longa]QDU81901.1 hypothetical protein Pla110_36520 [Polystyrenella longa]
MSVLLRLSLFIMALSYVVLTTERTLCAEEVASPLVEVTTSNGREIRGLVDSRTNGAELVLTVTSTDIQVNSHLPWSSISSIRLGGHTLTLEELKAELPAIQSDFNMRPAFGGWTSEGIHISQISAIEDGYLQPFPVEPAVGFYPPTPEYRQDVPRVASLNITARVANWDRDPERDGLLVEVQPLSATGEIIPVTGQLECELIIQHKTWRGGEYIERLDSRFSVLDRWTDPVKADQFYSLGIVQGTVIQLPYRVRHPEARLNIDSDALLHARLKVPGQGVFEASYAIVRLRPYSSIRDDYQQYRGQRYFPQERARFIPRNPLHR